jgi:para-aminobenzoate synthetase component 1
MKRLQLAELPYHPDSSRLFDAIADDPWAVFLDSGRPLVSQGRYDIMAADPVLTLTTRGEWTEVSDGHRTTRYSDEPFALLRTLLGKHAPGVPGLPFAGGALGYFAYDLGRRVEPFAPAPGKPRSVPDMAVGIYDRVLVVDHQRRRTHLVSRGRDRRAARTWPALFRRLRNNPPAESGRLPMEVVAPARSNMSFDDYADAFRRIKHYIREGDCYQVNLAQRFEAQVCGSPWQGYRDLRRLNPAPFAAYLNTPACQVLSNSPERFLKVADGAVETRPIKGTRPRARHPQEDLWLAEALRHSIKDRAENLMIVDLLRNDLGKVCACGSVRVPALFAVESFATVHHLVSTVTGKLSTGRDALDLLRACFPGGSITGAPKLRAMQIIEELEPHARAVYCGSIGYIGFDGAMDTSIAIRTLVHENGRLSFSAGGGIVADSSLEAEYRETFDKAAAILRWLEQLDLDHVDRETRRQSGHC